MENKVVIVGKAASGKDYLREHFERCGLLVCVSDTTRPKREGEVEGKEYNFIDKHTFLNRKANAKYVESGYFNTWYYGTPKDEWYSKDVFILTPSSVKTLKPKDRELCTVVYLDINEKVIRKRLEERGDIDTVERRMTSDNKDFLDFNDYDVKISEPEFCADTLLAYLQNPSKAKKVWLVFKNNLWRVKHLKF